MTPAAPSPRAGSGLGQKIRASGVRPWLLVAALFLPLVSFSVDLGTPSLWDPDEGRHAEIAREMLISGEWLTPQLNFLPHRETPPAYYWLLATALGAFGSKNEAAARLPSAILGVFGVWMALAWGWSHLRPLAGTLAALILTTAAGYVGMGRLVLVDAVFGLLLGMALLAMGDVLLRGGRRAAALFYLLLTAATLVRGPIALVLAALVALGFAGLVGDWKGLLRLRPVAGSCFLVLTILPLALAVAAKDLDYLPELLWRHNVLRFVGSELTGGHPRSLFFYFWITPLLMLPWGLFLPWVFRDAFRSGGERMPVARLYLLAWIGVFLAFYSLSATKLPSDMLPLFFPLALLTGRSLNRLLRRVPSVKLLEDPVLAGSLGVFVAAILLPLVGYQILVNFFPMYVEKVVYVLLLVPVAVAGLTAVGYRSRPGALGWIAACGLTAIIGLYRFGAQTVSAYNSMEVPADLIALKLPRTAPLVSYRTTSHSLAFYSGRPVRTLENLGLAAPLLNGDAPAALLTKERYLQEVRAQLRRSLYIWWEGDSKKVLLANRPPPTGADSRILLPLAAARPGPS